VPAVWFFDDIGLLGHVERILWCWSPNRGFRPIHIDIFTDISPLLVINNESGWYEGWMIHDITVPEVAPPRPDGHPGICATAPI